MNLIAILSLVSTFLKLVDTCIDKFVPEKRTPTFRRVGKKAVKIPRDWTIERIARIGGMKGLV